MHQERSVRRPFLWVKRLLRLTSLALFCLPSLCMAQDVAEAARQEKARKAAEAKKSGHVYTNDDLKRSQILTREDQARALAQKKEQAIPPADQPAPALDAGNPRSHESLGEVARRYRREKAAREAEQALKTLPRSGFPMNLAQPSLATPAAPVRVPPASVPAPPPKPGRSPVIMTAPGRRDPFSRSPRAIPSPLLPPASISVPSSPPVLSPKVATIDPRRPQPRSAVPVPPRNVGLPAPMVHATNVTVQPGDSLWKLARRHLGRGSRWPDWLLVNPGLPPPDRIQPGTILHLPTSAGPATSLAAQAKSISAQRGDSLWKIAKVHLGSGARWVCLAEANPQLLDADHIYPGQFIQVPANCRPSP